MRGRLSSFKTPIGSSVPSFAAARTAVLLAIGFATSIRAGGQEPRAPAHVDSAHVRRGRLLGVYDAASGEPLADVVVTNSFNGLSARTTATGTLSLFFVDTSGGLLRIQRVGYKPMTMVALNSDRDTVPLTVLLESTAQRLAPVVTTAHSRRGPADTVRSLEDHGFYERRLTSGAPSSSFVTADKIEKLSMISDVRALTGREICLANVYVNGVRLAPMARASSKGRVANNLTQNPVDQLFTPSDVLAIEMYRTGELPAEYGMTAPADCITTLIWTK